MSQAQILRVVIASPNDVLAERRAIDGIAEELNHSIAELYGLHIKISKWETEVYPSFHPKGPQGAIDSVLHIENCDLLIGIFWKRFGTPTTDANSGTEHEFRKAYEAWKRTGRPQIMMYFNKKMSDLPDTDEEIEQLRQIVHFRNEFPKEGLWSEYKGNTEFAKLVRRHLTQFILRTFNNNINTSSIRPTQQRPSLDEQISLWLDAKAKSQRTREKYEQNIMEFLEVLSKKGLNLYSEDVTAIQTLLKSWAEYGKQGKIYADATFNQHRDTISSFYNYAIRQDWTTSNPIEAVPRHQDEEHKNKAQPLDVEAVKNILKSIDRSTPLGKRDYALLCLLLTTGLHVSEVADLRCGAITREKNSMAITFKLSRTGEDLSVPLSPGVAKSLNEYISTAYPDGFTVESPLWLSYSKYNKSKREAIGTQAISDVCSKYLGTSKVEATKRTFDAMRNKWGMKGIEKVLGIN